MSFVFLLHVYLHVVGCCPLMYTIKYNLHRRLVVRRDRLIEGAVVRVFAYRDSVVKVSRYGIIDVIDKYIK